MKWEKETLIIYDKFGRIIKERNITNLPYPIQLIRIKVSMQHTLMADHWDIVRVKKKKK